MLLVTEVPVVAGSISWQVSSYLRQDASVVPCALTPVHHPRMGCGAADMNLSNSKPVSWPVERFFIQDVDASRVTLSN